MKVAGVAAVTGAGGGIGFATAHTPDRSSQWR